MATWLKQSTAVDVKVGPFVDSTDGFTPETALTITQPDIRLAKNGGAFAQKNAAQTLAHEENGWYEVALDATDTNTLGILIVAIYEAGALPVWREFLVVAANIYDSLIGGGDLLQVDDQQLLGTAYAAPTVAGVPEVDVTHWLGTAAATPSVAGVPEVDLTHWLGVAPLALSSQRVQVLVGAITNGVIAAATFAANALAAVWDELKSAHTTPDSFGDYLDDEVTSRAAPGDQMNLANDAITAAKIAADAIGASELAADAVTEIAAAIPTAAVVADAVWDEALASHVAAGSAGKKLGDLVNAGGSGALTRTIRCRDQALNPIEGASVWVATDAAGTNVVAGALTTSSLGIVTVLLDAGTYYVWAQKDGQVAVIGQAMVIS